MVDSIKRVSVFLSSPGDLQAERNLVREVCEEINLDQGNIAGFIIQLLSSDTHTHPSIGVSAQAVINQQIGDRYQIYLGLMGTRFGTATPNWGSGTEEEYEVALTRWVGDKSPDIMFYFINKHADPFSLDQEQLQRVRAFREKLKANGVYYFMASNDTALKTLLHRHVSRAVHEVLRRDAAPSEADPPSAEAEIRGLDHLPNWRHLLASDPEVGSLRMLNDATSHMKAYTALNQRLSDSISRFSRNLRVQNTKLTDANSRRSTRDQIRVIEELSVLLTSYVEGLLEVIPKLHIEAKSGIVLSQRAFNIASSAKLIEVEQLQAHNASRKGLRDSISSLRPVIKQSTESFVLWPDSIFTVRIHKRMIAALHADMDVFLAEMIGLLDDIAPEQTERQSLPQT